MIVIRKSGNPVRGIFVILPFIQISPQLACGAGGQNASPWRGAAEPGDTDGKIKRACEAGDRILSPQVSCIEINVVGRQQRFELFFERMLAMMLFLISNVTSHALDLRFADCESCESCLPAKSSRGLCLAQLDDPDLSLLRNSETEIVGRSLARMWT